MIIVYRIVTRRVALSREVDVCCDKCQTEFVYTLTRTGSGSTIVLYMVLGQATAAERAQRAATRHAERRIARERDLVPCPKCGWVNREAIRHYHLAGGRTLMVVAIAAMVVIFVCALGTQIADVHFHVEHDLLSAILFSLLATLVVLPIVLIVHVVRRLGINPNRAYPGPPKLPPGMPSARLKGRSTPAPLPPPPLPLPRQPVRRA